MTLRRFDPVRDLLNLQERMNRLLEGSLGRGREGRPDAGAWAPLADVHEGRDGTTAILEVPGLRDEDLRVDVTEDRLLVRGERQLPAHTRPESYHRMERSYGPFLRTFRLSHAVDVARVTAVLKDGVLRIELPRARGPEPVRPRAERRE